MTSSSEMPWVYVLRCADNTLYVGHTKNVGFRESAHQQGLGPRYTALRLPAQVVYAEEHETMAGAIRRERQLKRWSGQKKRALAAGDLTRLKELSRRRSNRQKPSG